MAGALRKTMVYLGLAEDEGRYYDEAYDEYDTDESAETEEPRERAAEQRTDDRGEAGVGFALRDARKAEAKRTEHLLGSIAPA